MHPTVWLLIVPAIFMPQITEATPSRNSRPAALARFSPLVCAARWGWLLIVQATFSCRTTWALILAEPRSRSSHQTASVRSSPLGQAWSPTRQAWLLTGRVVYFWQTSGAVLATAELK